MFWVTIRLALSLCQYVLRPRRSLLHQHNRKGMVVIVKTRRYKRLVLGSLFAPETDMIFGDGVGASLVHPHVAPRRSDFGERSLYGINADLVILHSGLTRWVMRIEVPPNQINSIALLAATRYQMLNSIWLPPSPNDVEPAVTIGLLGSSLLGTTTSCASDWCHAWSIRANGPVFEAWTLAWHRWWLQRVPT